MSIWKRLILITIMVIPGLFWGCKPPIISEENYRGEPGDKIIATDDAGLTLTVAEIYEGLRNSNLAPRGGTLSKEEVALFVDSMLMDTLTGLKADEDVVLENYKHHFWTYRLRYHDYLLRVWVREAVYPQIPADSEHVIDYFNAHPEKFSIEEQVFVSHILISPRWFKIGEDSAYYRSLSDEQFDAEVKAYADSVYQKLVDGEPFAQVAQNYTHDKLSNAEGGMVGWTTRGKYIDPFDSVAFSLKPGEFSKPYWDRDGWHIVYVTDHLAAGLPPLDRPQYWQTAVRGYMSHHVNRITDSILDSLRADMDLVYNEQWLDSNVFTAPEFIWGAIVNSTDTIDMKLMRNLEMKYRRDNQVVNTTGDLKRQLINELAARFLVIQQVRAHQMDTLPDVKAEEYRIRHETTRMITLVERFDPTWRPSDSAIAAYYNENIDKYVSDKPMRIQEIIVSDSLLAEFIRDQAMSGVALDDLAQDYSLGAETIKAKLTDPKDVGEADVDPEFWKVLKEIPEGEVSAPFRYENAYHVIKMLRLIRNTPLAQARSGIVTILSNQYERDHIRQYVDDLYERYHIRFVGDLPLFHLKPLNYRRDQQGQ